jgi:hypothetical protein
MKAVSYYVSVHTSMCCAVAAQELISYTLYPSLSVLPSGHWTAVHDRWTPQAP